MNITVLSLILLKVILILSLILTAFTFFRDGRRRGDVHKYMYATACILTSLYLTGYLLNSYLEPDIRGIVLNIIDWMFISGIVLLLTGLGIMIRLSKPKIARAPAILAYLPVLILIVYPFVIETLLLKDFLYNLLFAGAMLISIMMFIILAQRNRNYYRIVVAVSLFTIALISSVMDYSLHLVLILLIAGTIIVNTAYKRNLLEI